MAATSDESMPPERPMTTSVKPFLRDVVAGAEHQRLVDLAHRRERRRRPAAARVGRVGRRRGDDETSTTGSGVVGGPAPGVEQALAERRADLEVDDQRRSSNWAARATSSPSASNTIDAPSKTSSSWPPTWLT